MSTGRRIEVEPELVTRTDLEKRPELLEGRVARCTYDNGVTHHAGYPVRTTPSTLNLPFFEYRGPGSDWAVRGCKNCMYFKSAHDPNHHAFRDRNGKQYRPTVVEEGKCSGFESRGPADEDQYYCGCWGWD